MRLTSLRMQNFKRHSDLAVDLAPGLTVIRGPNEAGKSTVQRAIEMGLYRRPNSTSDDLDGLRSWSVSDGAPTVTINFEDDGAAGELKKVFAGTRGSVELRWGNEVQTDPAAVEKVVSGNAERVYNL